MLVMLLASWPRPKHSNDRVMSESVSRCCLLTYSCMPFSSRQQLAAKHLDPSILGKSVSGSAIAWIGWPGQTPKTTAKKKLGIMSGAHKRKDLLGLPVDFGQNGWRLS
jgi:hypothetical protein